jgi:hypothetical protein
VRLENGFGVPRPPQTPTGATPNPPAPRGRRLEGNRVQRPAGCREPALWPRSGRVFWGGGLTPPGGARRSAGALHGPRRHLSGSGELRGRSGGVFRRPQEPHPLRRYHPLLVGVPYRNTPSTGVNAATTLSNSLDTIRWRSTVGTSISSCVLRTLDGFDCVLRFLEGFVSTKSLPKTLRAFFLRFFFPVDL